jgi:hypothetical protein
LPHPWRYSRAPTAITKATFGTTFGNRHAIIWERPWPPPLRNSGAPFATPRASFGIVLATTLAQCGSVADKCHGAILEHPWPPPWRLLGAPPGRRQCAIQERHWLSPCHYSGLFLARQGHNLRKPFAAAEAQFRFFPSHCQGAIREYPWPPPERHPRASLTSVSGHYRGVIRGCR